MTTQAAQVVASSADLVGSAVVLIICAFVGAVCGAVGTYFAIRRAERHRLVNERKFQAYSAVIGRWVRLQRCIERWPKKHGAITELIQEVDAYYDENAFLLTEGLKEDIDSFVTSKLLPWYRQEDKKLHMQLKGPAPAEIRAGIQELRQKLETQMRETFPLAMQG